jgi:uncharacterized UPF0160 family protein
MAAETASKRLKMDGTRIGTHNGHFHADEALAVYMLRLLPEYTDAALTRTRDQSILDQCHTVVDVGGEYDVTKNRYDHHQRTFNTTFPAHQTKLSSAGLVYMHFGKALIAQHAQKLQQLITQDDLDLVHVKLYDDFIEAIDANDNGINKFDTTSLEQAGIQQRFKDNGITLASQVNDLNHEDPLKLDAPSRSTESEPQAEEDYRFSRASTLMGENFVRKLHGALTAWLPARTIVKQTFEDRVNQHPSSQLMVLPRAGVPWKEHLYNIEEESGLPADKQVLFVIYPEKEEVGSKWRIQAVSKSFSSFENRKSLPEPWRGIRDAELDQLLGGDVEDGAVFVHASGFIGGHKSEAGVRAMANLALAA